MYQCLTMVHHLGMVLQKSACFSGVIAISRHNFTDTQCCNDAI